MFTKNFILHKGRHQAIWAIVGSLFFLLIACSGSADIETPPTDQEPAEQITSPIDPPQASSGGLVVEQTIEEIATQANHISISQVKDVQSAWNADQTVIETTVTFTIEEYIKGTEMPSEFNLKIPGGTVDGISMMESGVPAFNQSEKVLLFLQEDHSPATLATGNWQSVFYIEEDQAIQRETNQQLPLRELKALIRSVSSLMVPAPAYNGALMFKRTVAELSTEANRILIAEVTSVQSRFNENNSIETELILDVDKILKGTATAQERLLLPGGEVEGVIQMVGGVPNFITGERVLLFLDDHPEFLIAGLWQGKYTLSGDQAFQAETGQSIPVNVLEEEISRALETPVEIGTSPEVVHAEYKISCPAWLEIQVPVPHYVNLNNPGNGSPTGAALMRLVYDSLYAWQELPEAWITQSIEGTTTNSSNNFDGENVIIWDSLSGGTLGINTCWFAGNKRLESDTRFDNSDREWTITGEASKIDLRSTMEHEFGHGIGLGHSDQFCDGSIATPLMCPSVSAGVRKVILTDDINGTEALYPLSGDPPTAPSNLNMIPLGTSNSLSWSDNSSNEHAFEIQRAENSCSNFKAIATVSANSTTYTDNEFGDGLSGTYCYRLKALNKGGDSAFSNQATTEKLTVTKSIASSSTITSGGTITYVVTIKNGTAEALTGMTVGDTLPTYTTYITDSATADPDIVPFNIFPLGTTNPFTLPSSSNVILTYQVKVGNVTEGETLTNTVQVSAFKLDPIATIHTAIVGAKKLYLPLIVK